MQTTNCSSEEGVFQVRKLEISDKKKGFVELLQQLSVCDSISDEAFEERFLEVAKYGDDHLICVVEDKDSAKIIATGSLFIEKKFIRNCGKVGHIEDVVVDSNVRGKHLGKKIIDFLSDHARSTGCYKVILDCTTDNMPFMRGVVSSTRKFRWSSTLFDIQSSFASFVTSRIEYANCGCLCMPEQVVFRSLFNRS